MEELFEQQKTVSVSMTDRSGQISYADVFRIFMDAAGDHAERIGVGIGAMREKGLFWLTVRTKIRFYHRPGLFENITVRTWPMAPERVRGLRCYELVSDEGLAASGKTEWAVMNIETGRIASLAGVYPEEFRFPERLSLDEPFARIGYDGSAPGGEYAVRSTDIDVGGHMNNVAYIDALMGMFTGAELDALSPAVIEAVFRAPCFEGDRLAFTRTETETGSDCAFIKSGSPVFMARLTR